MNDSRFLLNSRALLAYNSLTQAERDAIGEAMAALGDLPAEDWPSAGGRKLASADPLYLVRVDASLRAIVRPSARGQPEILDLVRRETLQQFRQAAGDPAPHA